ncbi:MAG: DsbE family thiol:disulfide interchange protein [Pseudomonadota bacterium]
MSDVASGDKRRNALWALIPLAVFLAFAALAWAMLGRDKDTLPSALIDDPAPQFELEGLREGEGVFSTADLTAGEPTVVNVWASWCGPCRIEHPELMRLAEMGVTVHGLNYKDGGAGARGFLEELGDPYAKVGVDQTGRAGIEWGVYGVPETFVVTGDGRIAYKHVGPIQNDDLEVKLLPALRAAGWDG